MRQQLGFQIIVIILICCLDSCKLESSSGEVFYEMKIDSTYSFLSDSTFLNQVTNINSIGREWVICDYKSNRLIKFNPANNRTIDVFAFGKGPGDLFGPISTYCTNDSIYVFEEMNQRISVFTTSLVFKRIIPNSFHGFMKNHFIVDTNNNLLCSVRGDSSKLLKINLTNNEKILFGKPESAQWIKDTYQLLLNNNLILALHVSKPTIELYCSNSLKQANEFDYSFLSSVTSRVQYAETDLVKKGNPKNVSYLIIQDVDSFKDNLYILIIDHLNGDNHCNLILEFQVKGSKIVYNRTLKPKDEDGLEWIGAFKVISDNTLLAFSSVTSELVKFVF